MLWLPAAPLNSMVEPVPVKLPLLIQLPAIWWRLAPKSTVAPALMVRLPLTSRPVVTIDFVPLPLNAMLLNEETPRVTLCGELPLKVTVAVPGVTAPALVQLPA